jgi:protoheme IX farnesyltransferase
VIAEVQDVLSQPSVARQHAIRAVLADYLSLAKPRIMVLLLVTEFMAMITAARGWPGTSLTLAALIGGALSAGGASAINCWFDKDIDAVMARTCTRPVPAGRIPAANALIFGIALGVAGFIVLALSANLLTAGLALAGGLVYVFIYTVWLKRSTRQNIVIGGAAGAIPPLVGWAATTGGLSWTALYLFAIVFYWTPPHFWALSLLMKDEYAKVGVPMMPVVRGERETRRQILLYSLLLYAVSQLPFCAGGFGTTYLLASMTLGAAFIAGAVRLYRRADRRSALRLYLFSLLYLALLFGAMVLDAQL